MLASHHSLVTKSHLAISFVQACSPPIRYMVTITPAAGLPRLVSRIWEDTGSGWLRDTDLDPELDTEEPTSANCPGSRLGSTWNQSVMKSFKMQSLLHCYNSDSLTGLSGWEIIIEFEESSCWMSMRFWDKSRQGGNILTAVWLFDLINCEYFLTAWNFPKSWQALSEIQLHSIQKRILLWSKHQFEKIFHLLPRTLEYRDQRAFTAYS